MKKRTSSILLAVLSLLCLSSCATYLSVPYSEPSNVNMASYRSVAISETPVYLSVQTVPGYMRFTSSTPGLVLPTSVRSTINNTLLAETAADSLTKGLENVFSSSYYKMVPHASTDAYLSLYRIGRNPSAAMAADGIDALVVPRIIRLVNDEWVEAVVTKDQSGNIKTTYWLWRSVDMAVTVTVLDVESDKVVAMREYHAADKERRQYDVLHPENSTFTQRMMVEDAVRSIMNEVRADFVPSSRSYSIALMANKPENASVKDAYKAAGDGNHSYALSLFLSAWETSGHIPSAYNAALIRASRGDIKGALSFLESVRERVNDSSVNNLWRTLERLDSLNERAAEQYAAPESPHTETVSPYAYLFY